jgi:hypothetical protein
LEYLTRRGWQLRPFRQAELDAYNFERSVDPQEKPTSLR